MKFYNSVIKVQINGLMTGLLLLLAHFVEAQNCAYSLKLMDLGRNGWGTAGVLVQITGQSDSIYRHVMGDSTRFSLSVRQGDSIRITYVRSTDFSDGQNRFVLYDVNGDTVKAGQGTIVGLGNPFTFGEIASCAACRRTNNVQVRRVSATYVQLHWDILANDASAYAVEYGPVGFRPGTGTIKTALDTLFYLTGLREFTEYDVYVSSVCGGNKGAYGQPTQFKTYYATDVAVVDLVNPRSRCMMGNDTIKILIKNFGGTPQTLIQFRYSINGILGSVSPPVDGMYTGVISKDSVATVQFKIPYDFSRPGDYDFRAWVEVPNDSLTPNDTFRTVITSVPTITSLPYVNGFEPNRGGWTIGRESVAASWEHGKPADANGNITSAASGNKVWTTNLIGNYNNNEKSYLYSPCLDFASAVADPEIAFSLNYNAESGYDGMRLEGSTDNGVTWATIGSTGSGLNWYNDTVRSLRSRGWTGNSGGWIVAKDVLRGFRGNANCRLRFVFAADISVNTYDGFAIDNMVIRLPITTDLAAANATNKDKTICGTPNDSVTVKITNLSNMRQYRYAASYRINGGAVVTENIDSIDIAAGASALYTFRTAFNSTADGDYKVETWVKLANDPAAYNDSTAFSFNRVAAVNLPTAHPFNNYLLPTNWVLSRAAAGVERGGHGNRGTNGYLYANIYGGAGRTFTATTSKLGLVRPLDSMSYDYRAVSSLPPFAGYGMVTNDSLFVEAASCGGAWVGLDTVHAGNHMVDTLYKNRKLSLRSVSGGNIQVRFRVKSATSDFNGYFMDLDNINFFGCQKLNITGSVTDARLFTSNDGRIQAGAANGVAPYTYTWNYFNTPTALTGNDIRNLPAGTYTVRVTDARGCFDEKTFTVSFGNRVFEVGSAIAKVQLAPNPTTGTTMLTVSYNKMLDARVQVYRITGQLVYETESRQTQDASYELDLSNFAAGMYLVRITAENKTHVERLMKQ
jgi:hypothetical protein